MSAEHHAIDVYESTIFSKQLAKLSEEQLKIVEDEIDKIIDAPELGERKVGDLDYLWVHKFKIEGLLVLLGYSWVEGKLELYLLNIGPHENFYQQIKKRRKADIQLIK